MQGVNSESMSRATAGNGERFGLEREPQAVFPALRLTSAARGVQIYA